jgi:hypothetical protein
MLVKVYRIIPMIGAGKLQVAEDGGVQGQHVNARYVDGMVLPTDQLTKREVG